MEIQGRIIAVMPKASGTSQRTGSTWASQDYVIETHEQYPRKCVFRVFGEDKIANMNIQIGEELLVSFDIDAREYNGRWYNDIRAWKVDRVDPNQQAAQAAPQPAPQPVQQAYTQPAAAPQQPAAAPQAQPAADPFSGGDSDNLPF